MPLHCPPPPDFVRSSSFDKDKGAPSPHTIALTVDELKLTSTLAKTQRTRGHTVSPSTAKHTKRARLLLFSDTVTVFDSSDDGINEPIVPPIINHLSCYVKRAKANPKPYSWKGPNTFECCFFDRQLCHNDSMSLEDTQMSSDALKHRLQHLSSEAAAQAVVTMHADVEWRCMCTLTTAWEIHVCKQHLKFLHMVLEDEGDTYTSASLESLHVSLKGLARTPKKKIEDDIGFGVSTYSDDVTSFAVGDVQLACLESAALTYSDSSESTSSGDSSSESDVDPNSQEFPLWA
ncbi:hypothetical protein BDR05DRAFT_1003942 [Suillus weaverae]|nr:hypothetical protein BDR05DRAFT_1003942 [Suillus weaverae]